MISNLIRQRKHHLARARAIQGWGLFAVAIILSLLFGCGEQETVNADAASAAPQATTAIASDEPMAIRGASSPERTASSPAFVPKPVFDQQTFEDHVRPFFAANCEKCHAKEKPEADLRLDALQADFLHRPEADHWVEILDRLNLGDMPPEDEPRPDPEALTKVVDWITLELKHASAQGQSTGGRVLLRRLTRLEYANTVRDLLNVEFTGGDSPLEALPPDGAIAGFDRVSKALLLDPSLMEAYLTVAENVVDKAVVFRPPLVPERTLRFEFDRTPHTAMRYIPENRSAFLEGDFLVVMEQAARTYGKLYHPFGEKEIPISGRYRIRIRAAADQGASGQPVFMDVSYGSAGLQARFRVEATKEGPKVYEFEKTFDALTPGEFSVGIANGTRFTEGNAEWYQQHGELTRLAEAGKTFEATRMKARMRAEGAYDTYVRSSYLPGVLHLETVPKLYLEWIELIGPLQGDYPPKSIATIFGDDETAARFNQPGIEQSQLLKDCRQVFHRLLPRAFRRPVQNDEVEALVDLVESELTAGARPDEALKTGLIAMLCSPDFLYLFEPAQDETPPRRLSDFELATRLSYFLWSTMPDEEFSRLAGSGMLRSREVLAGQVDRMLTDPKVEGFVQGFARQWLKVDEFHRFQPDREIYPAFYATELAGIKEDVEQEALAFFREVLTKEEPVSSFLDSDWLMLNERLAKLYDIPHVNGDEFRRVSLPRHDSQSAGHRRGGLLGMAGLHLWGADGNRTKPVERGKYLLAVLFNDPPPPPPPNAGEVEPNLRGEMLTVRERLARHREQTTCNNCHRRIDPYGLALENFNAIGQWRDKLDGERPLNHWWGDRPAIDASGTLPNGRSFSDFVEFKAAILEQKPRFHRALAEKLLTYSLGRTIDASDRQTIDDILLAMQQDGPTFRTMLKAIALSESFGQK